MEAPPTLLPGQRVSIQTSDRTLTLTIDRPFAPFTKSVVLLARSPQLGPDPVVVKIYDPRFLDERLVDHQYQPSRPWSLEIEKAATAIWHDVFDRDALWEDEPPDAEGRARLAALWEKHFRHLSTECFESEWEAYGRLVPLQGSVIPRLLLTGTFLPPDERAIQPPALIVEYIPNAVSLGDVPAELLQPEVCATLMRTIDSFASYGVIHTDINLNNILFTPGEQPTRGVVIDFGCAGVREVDEDDDAWQERVRFASDGPFLRLMLEKKGISIVNE